MTIFEYFSNLGYKLINKENTDKKGDIKMGIISWIILGALAGWIASKMMNTDESMGGFANIAVGIIGALIGGFIMNFFNKAGAYSLNLYSLFVALLGSIILLAIIKVIVRK